MSRKEVPLRILTEGSQGNGVEEDFGECLFIRVDDIVELNEPVVLFVQCAALNVKTNTASEVCIDKLQKQLVHLGSTQHMHCSIDSQRALTGMGLLGGGRETSSKISQPR